MTKTIALLLSMICLCSSLQAYVLPHKIYIDTKEMDTAEDRFRIHLGHNVWIEANTVYRDESGMYTLDSHVMRAFTNQYEKKWKCPYCYQYWPIGSPCGNKDCPSKYK